MLKDNSQKENETFTKHEEMFYLISDQRKSRTGPFCRKVLLLSTIFMVRLCMLYF